MEIKRTTEIFIETNRRFIIRQPDSFDQVCCPKCNEPMLTVEQSATGFGISQRRLFRLVETDAIHFAEIETGAVMICPASLGGIADDNATQLAAAICDEN